MFPFRSLFYSVIALCGLTVAIPEPTAEAPTRTVDLWLPGITSLPSVGFVLTEITAKPDITSYNLCVNDGLPEFCDKHGFFVAQGPNTYEFSVKEPIVATKVTVKCSLEATTLAVCTDTVTHLDQGGRVDETTSTITEPSLLRRTAVPLVGSPSSASRTRATLNWVAGCMALTMGVFAAL